VVKFKPLAGGHCKTATAFTAW